MLRATPLTLRSGWSVCQVGVSPTAKRRLFTAHANRRHSITPRNAFHRFLSTVEPCKGRRPVPAAPRHPQASELLARVCRWLLELLHDLIQVVARCILKGRELLVGFQLLQPQCLTHGATSGPMQPASFDRIFVVLPANLIQYRHLQPSMETPVAHVIFVLLALTATAHARAVVFTFDQWARLSVGLKEIYISGAIDAVFTIAVPAQAGTA